MDALRVSLVVIGVLLVIAIYVYSRRELGAADKRLQIKIPQIKIPRQWFRDLSRFFPKRSSHPKPANQPVIDEHTYVEPQINVDDLNAIEEIVPSHSIDMTDIAEDVSLIVELTSDQIAPEGEQLFIPLTIVGRHGRHITGETIQHACDECDFVLKDTGIYYYEVGDVQGFKQNLLGLANILEPGTFNQESMYTFETPGLVLFLHLPAPVEAREAFDILISKGRDLAEVLEGELCDDARNVLTNQAIAHLKEKVEAYRFKQKMTQIKNRR